MERFVNYLRVLIRGAPQGGIHSKSQEDPWRWSFLHEQGQRTVLKKLGKGKSGASYVHWKSDRVIPKLGVYVTSEHFKRDEDWLLARTHWGCFRQEPSRWKSGKGHSPRPIQPPPRFPPRRKKILAFRNPVKTWVRGFATPYPKFDMHIQPKVPQGLLRAPRYSILHTSTELIVAHWEDSYHDIGRNRHNCKCLEQERPRWEEEVGPD